MVGTGVGAEKGILIKGAEALETMHAIDTIVFDKTGTITQGKPEVTNVWIAPKLNEKDTFALLRGLEEKSEHPLAQAIVQFIQTKKIPPAKIDSFKALFGKGVVGRKKGVEYKLGNIRWMEEQKISLREHEETIEEWENDGKTVVVLTSGRKVLAILGIADVLKESARATIAELKHMNKEIWMITGDNERTARAIAAQAGIVHVFAHVLPEEKANNVKKLQAKGKKVAFVGDGINDAPALAQADLGIAMGSGTDIAIEAGDIVLMKGNPYDVVNALLLGKATMGKIKQGMFWALIYNIIGIPIAAGVLYAYTGWLLSPILAGGAMALSSVSVVTNALLLRGIKFKKEK